MERWIGALDELEASAGYSDDTTASPSWSSSLTGMRDVEALSYANQLLLGSQKMLNGYSESEAERRAQVINLTALLSVRHFLGNYSQSECFSVSGGYC